MPDFIVPLLVDAQGFFARATPDLPPAMYWMAAIVFILLVVCAVIDAFTSTVPDPLIFLGLTAVTGAIGYYWSWPMAAENLAWSLGAGLIIWAANEAWYYTHKKDALGMGDAKWTMLAVSCFGWQASMFAWGLGACIAIIWMVGMRVARYPITRVHFAPFLMVGLVVGIWWLRFRT